MTEQIKTNLDNKILTISFNRGEKKNAFTSEMYLSLSNILNEASSNPDISVIVFHGGNDFSAGNDLIDFINNPPEDETAPPFKFMCAVLECPLPLIAAVDGFAVGIGTTLLLHCEFVYAAHESVFMLPFINLGLTPEFASSQVLPMLVGYVRASELLLLGERFDAQKAYDLGIVNELCSKNTVFEAAMNTARKLADKPRESLVQTKALLRRNSESLIERTVHEAKEFSKAIASPHAKAAMNKVLKR